MTVETQVNQVTANGTGSATVFSFSPVVITESSDLEVTKVNVDGSETLLSEGSTSTTYSVSVASYPGTGSITYPASGGTPLTNGQSLKMRRKLPLLQEVSLSNQGGYHPKTQERALDRLTMIAQQHQNELDRAPKFTVGADLATGPFNPSTIPTPVPGYALIANAAGTGFGWAATVSQSLVDQALAAVANAEAAQAAAEAAAADAAADAARVPTPADPGDNGKFLRANAGVFELGSPVAGGDVVGPASATNRAIALFDTTTGKLLKNGPALGTSGHPLVSAGSGADPAFGQVPTAGIADLAVTAAKIAANTITLNKMARVGTSGHVLYSGGAGADPAYGALPAAGENNTASNVGTGAGVWKDKNGVDLRFRSIKAGTVSTVVQQSGSVYALSGTITCVENTNDVTINLSLTFTHPNDPMGMGMGI